MTRQEAIDVLMAVGVCTVPQLKCEKHCPLVEKCGAAPDSRWTEKEVAEAVKLLTAERSNI